MSSSDERDFAEEAANEELLHEHDWDGVSEFCQHCWHYSQDGLFCCLCPARKPGE